MDKKQILEKLEKEKDRLLNELFETGKATAEFKILAGKKTVKISTISTEDQLAVEESLPNTGSNIHYLHQFSIKTLCHTLLEIDGRSLPKEKEEYLKGLPIKLVEHFMRIQSALEEAVTVLVTSENIEQVFFTQKPPKPNLTLQPKE